jgi:hypothetical protein
MPKSLWNVQAREELLDRLERLRPESKPRWGRMNAPQMLAHLRMWMQMATGEIRTANKKLPLRYPLVKQLLIYWLPFPKGVPTAPELISRETQDWATEYAAVRAYLQSLEAASPGSEWPEHPAFGTITTRAWGVLAYRHTDHHFNQFGV